MEDLLGHFGRLLFDQFIECLFILFVKMFIIPEHMVLSHQPGLQSLDVFHHFIFVFFFSFQEGLMFLPFVDPLLKMAAYILICIWIVLPT